MDSIETLEEAMKVLDIISVFVNEESENYIKSDEIRDPLEKAFQIIFDIYESLKDDSIVEELLDKWENNNSTN